MSEIPNLERDFPEYRIYMGDDHKAGEKRDPWNMELKGTYGQVWYGGHGLFQAYCPALRVHKRLLAIDGVKTWQHGDTEIVVTLPPSSLRAVADLLKCRKRKVVSEETKARLAELRRKRVENG